MRIGAKYGCPVIAWLAFAAACAFYLSLRESWIREAGGWCGTVRLQIMQTVQLTAFLTFVLTAAAWFVAAREKADVRFTRLAFICSTIVSAAAVITMK